MSTTAQSTAVLKVTQTGLAIIILYRLIFFVPYTVPHNSGRCTYGTFDPAGWPARGHRARSDILGTLLHFSAFYYYCYSICNIFDSLTNYEYKRIYLPVMKMIVAYNYQVLWLIKLTIFVYIFLSGMCQDVKCRVYLKGHSNYHHLYH